MDNNNIQALSAVSPIDGRYAAQTEALRRYFSEGAFMRYRVRVEVEYFIALSQFGVELLADFPADKAADLRRLYQDFSTDDMLAIKHIEKTTNHDVKAVEYFIKEKLDGMGLGRYKEMVHFGLTSQDINNTSQPLMLKEALHDVVLPELEKVLGLLEEKAAEWRGVSMLARTHGQPASPTVLGKELHVFVERLRKQIDQLKAVPFSAKFGGATGNLNAHYVAYPEKDWVGFANRFVNEVLGLDRSQTTTQIEHYDNAAAVFDALKRINTICLDLCRDMWMYISMEYFKQKIKEGEVGSSAMPHKVNPIDFENAEGNLGLANAILQHLSAKLPVSRLQRDLTDSTVCRNVGVPLAHMVVSYKSVQKGLNKLVLNRAALEADLQNNWAVVAEAIQTVLRTKGYPNPYEALKQLTRTGEKITQDRIRQFIDGLEIPAGLKETLKQIAPDNYTGYYGLKNR
ncbi:MAG: adenylosuccinate lyase [Bacteroidales bacterium]|nr:adenylosuccinate lyase [Bacteroidales bacterium]